MDRKRILVACDDPDLLELLKMDLHMQGYEVRTAINGREALEMLLSEKFDLLLSDVMMPFVDGYHVASEATSKLGSAAPIIVISSQRDMARERDVAMWSGATEVLQQPFEMSDLHNLLERLLRERAQRPPGDIVKPFGLDALLGKIKRLLEDS